MKNRIRLRVNLSMIALKITYKEGNLFCVKSNEKSPKNIRTFIGKSEVSLISSCVNVISPMA